MHDELNVAKGAILQEIKSAVERGDISKIAYWSRLAEQCEVLIYEAQQLDGRVKELVNNSRARQDGIPPRSESGIEQKHGSFVTPGESPKLDGMKTRTAWLKMLVDRGIELTGHNKRYYTTDGRPIGIAFANQLRGRWFLGLKDEHVDVVVLLCRDRAGKLFDFVIPGSELRAVWKSLSRSGDQVKFNVLRDDGEFRLSFPPREFMDITKYLRNYDVLGKASGQ